VFGKHVKIGDDLYAKANRCAELSGYTSADEFIQHVVEREIGKIMGSSSNEDATPEEIKKRLQGLGYIE
jgi:hypothetical protein